MKIKTNVRAGAGRKSSINNTVASFVSPVNRCAGL